MKPRWIGVWTVLVSLVLMRCVAGETATALATVASGQVTAITVTSGGGGYTSEPVVTISGGGGSGATAKAVLEGDRVTSVTVLTSGSGYSSAPTVSIEAPPKALGLVLELVPKLTVEGLAGSVARVEWSTELTGPWTWWSNVVVSAEGVVLVDLRPGSERRYYRAVADPRPVGPAGYVWIPHGTFVMGSPEGEEGRFVDEVQHTVTLTRGFWLSDHEVTQGEYEAVMGSNPSLFKGDPNRPVEQVSWDDAVMYCRRLTERERAAGRITAQEAYRLPTEAEWQYAARAGTTGARPGDLEQIAWWTGSLGNQTNPVKQKAANAWGLYDMMGNVWEWCADWYGEYPRGTVTDPAGPTTGSVRVDLGGSWRSDARCIRSANRGRFEPGGRTGSLGLRPALSFVR